MIAPEIKDAATLVVIRHEDVPRVLMGKRAAGSAFMPSKYVFPGGRLDAEDAHVTLACPLKAATYETLCKESTVAPNMLAVAAIRELWEETGQLFSASGEAPNWQNFPVNHGLNAAPLTYFFRAVTPKGLPRRFDARFFMADAKHLSSDPDDFSTADIELSDLAWVTLEQARALDLPFITRLVIEEVEAHLRNTAKDGVPFIDNMADISQIRRL